MTIQRETNTEPWGKFSTDSTPSGCSFSSDDFNFNLRLHLLTRKSEIRAQSLIRLFRIRLFVLTKCLNLAGFQYSLLLKYSPDPFLQLQAQWVSCRLIFLRKILKIVLRNIKILEIKYIVDYITKSRSESFCTKFETETKASSWYSTRIPHLLKPFYRKHHNFCLKSGITGITFISNCCSQHHKILSLDS